MVIGAPIVKPPLSEIMQGIVNRVNEKTWLLTPSFSILFRFGPLNEVWKSVESSDEMIAWLVEGAQTPELGRDRTVSDIILALPTDEYWTMEQRRENNYKGKLLLAYDLLIEEIKNERRLSNCYGVDHRKHDLYYWGGGMPNGTNQVNLWNKKIDAVLIEGASLNIKRR